VVGKASRRKRNTAGRAVSGTGQGSPAVPLPIPRVPESRIPAVPAVGARWGNAHGLRFQVLEHTTIFEDGKRVEPSPMPGHSLERLVTKRVRIELPVVAVDGLSQRLALLLAEFDGVCPKPVVFVDTSNAGLAQKMRFGGHSINWQAHPGLASITIDSPETTEDVIAHEVMHGWLGLVHGYEDDRMYRNRQDHAAMFLVDTTQCMVLDCRVQEAIGARGFDPCFWTAEIVDCMYESGVALLHGLYPGSAYEASFAARLYALPEAVPHLFRFTPDLTGKFIFARNMIRDKMPELARLGDGIVRAFREGSYRTNQDAHRLIDRCLLLMADYVGMHLDLDRDLEIWQPPEPWPVDKFPKMLAGWPAALKYEINRRLIREGWPTGTLVQVSAGTDASTVRVTFHPTAGSPKAPALTSWEWHSPQPLALPAHPSTRFDDALERANRLRPKGRGLVRMGNPQFTAGGIPDPTIHGPRLGPATIRALEQAGIPIPGIPQAGPQPTGRPEQPLLHDPTVAPQPGSFHHNGPQTYQPAAPGQAVPRPGVENETMFTPRRGGPTMRYYLPGIGRFISRVRLHEAIAMGKTTYQELREVWGINIGPLGTPEAFARNRAPEHPYAYCENHPINCVDPSGLQGTARPTALAPRPPDTFCDRMRNFPYWDRVDRAIRTLASCSNNPIGLAKLRAIVRCIIWGESTDNPNATNGQFRGLMQIGNMNNATCCRITGTDFTLQENWANPTANILCGVHLLCDCLSHHDWNTHSCTGLYAAIDLDPYNRCRNCLT